MCELLCVNCENSLDVDYEMGGIFTCILSNRVETGMVRKCNHFKPRPKANKDFSKRTEKALATGKPPRKKSTRYV